MQRPTFVLSLVVCIAAFIVTGSWASSSVTVYKFKGVTDGRLPTSSLVEDEAGNFYGTTAYGGFANNNCSLGTCGTVFRFSRKQSGGWSESVIYSFTGGPDGSFPQGKLALDGMGNLYGTAVYGGSGYGTVFELTPNQNGEWSEVTIHTFQGGTDGFSPMTGVVLDPLGNLYGTDLGGGICHPCNGEVFQLTPVQGGSWNKSSVYAFSGDADGTPTSTITFDSVGNIYGTTISGGTGSACSSGCGKVYELVYSQQQGWSEVVLYNFMDGEDGSSPSSGVVFDPAGNLFGEASDGGSLACPGIGCGVIFELSPIAGGGWKDITIHSFNGPNGSRGQGPYGGLAFDIAGNLYGTTESGGDAGCFSGSGCGTVFKLSQSGSGSFTFTILGKLNDVDGYSPTTGVVVDAAGNIYGTAAGGGDFNCNAAPYGCGTVFSLSTGLGPFVSLVRTEGKAGQLDGILGQGFTGTTSVSFNGTPASFTIVSDTFLKTIIPSGATTGIVTVTTPGGTLTSNVAFHVIP